MGNAKRSLEATQFPMPKILVVDDEPRVVQAFRLVLEANGHEVIAASSKEAGEKAAIEHRPDLMTVDVSMPEGTEGFDLVAKIRRMEDPVLSAVPIIMVTGIHQTEYLGYYPDQAEGASALGGRLPVQGWLDKPTPADSLIEAVETALSRERQDRAGAGPERVAVSGEVCGPWLLLLAAAEDKSLDHAKLMNGAFLLTQALQERGMSSSYAFEPGPYGPFSRQVCSDLDALLAAGLIERQKAGHSVGIPTYHVSSEGRRRAEELRGELKAGWAAYLTDLRGWLDRQTFSTLWRHISKRYPEYTHAAILPDGLGEG